MDDRRMRRTSLGAIALALMCVTIARGQSPSESPRVARLVKQLGAGDFAARRDADRELLKLGPDSNKQLQEALQATDPEVRLRAQNLLERIAVVRLWEPTAVALDVNEQAVSTLFAGCAAQTGNHIFMGDPYGDFKNLPVTVCWGEKPYWQAIDELAHSTGNHVRIHYDNRTPGVVIAGGANGAFPTAYSGPFRAQLTNARHAFMEELDYERQSSEVTHSFQLNLQMLWEDRFRLAAYISQPEIVEARTDTGISLGATMPVSENWNVASADTRQISTSLRLNPPPASARTLSVLRLRWGILALGEMAFVELEQLSAKTQVHRDGLTLEIVTFDRQPTGRVDLTLVASRDIAVPDPVEILFQENEVELIDSLGRPLKIQSQSHTLCDHGVEIRLVFVPDLPDSTPAKLRFSYPKLRSKRDLEIIFRDVPLPIAKPE
jgi:hypothetical protein